MIETRGRVPVAASDKVSDVLARDESLIDVFERHAAHFSKLRNRSIRRVMARLVTVEQAARTAHVTTEDLVADLNRALGIAPASDVVPPPDTSLDDAQSGAQRHPPSAPVVELDVREDLRSGREPFSRIMSTVAALGADEVLHLRAIFEPAPLFAVLAKRGFAHESREHAPDDWSVWFWRDDNDVAAAEPSIGPSSDVPPDDATTTYLDVRGLNPPEPMMRTLVALESLRRGQTLVQINSRVPQLLLPMLAERGFACEIDDSRGDRVLVRIWRVR